VIRKLFILALIIIAGAVLWVVNPTGRLILAYSVLALAFVYFLFSIIFQEIISRRVEDAKTRHSLNRALTVAYVLIFLFTASALSDTRT